MSSLGILGEIMALNIFKPLFSCEVVKSLTRQTSLRFITESPKFDALKTNTKASPAKKAKEAYRSKDVLKLKEVDKKLKLVQPGYKVLDIGAAPGSWSQYLAEKTNANGKDKKEPVGLVVAIDLQSFDKIQGVHCLPKMDFLKASSQNKIVEILGRGKKFDFIFSNLSPPASGVPSVDEDRMIKSVLCVYLFMIKHLKQGGGCMVKLQGAEDTSNLQKEAKKLFKTVSSYLPVVPPMSDSDVYILGRDFKGVKM